MVGVARVAAASLALLCASLPLHAQDPVAPQPLRVRLDCAACGALPPAAQPWLRWVGAADTADVEVRVLRSTQDTMRYDVALTGAGRFEGVSGLLHYASVRDELPARLRDNLLHAVTLGLVRYAADTDLAPHLRIAFGAAGNPPAGEAARRPQQGPPAAQRAAASQKRWAAGLDLGFSGSSGNSDFVSLTSGVRLRHLQTNVFRLDWSAGFRYGESRGTVAARHVQSKLDFDLGPGARIAPFISMSGERDPFRRIDLRGRGGTGIRLAVHKDDNGEASLRGGVLYTHERFRPETGVSPRSDGLWSFKFTGNRQVGSAVRLENASSFDPTIGDFGDYNMEVTSKLSTRITRRLALTLSHTYAYDSTPVEGVQPTDQRFQTGLTLDF